MLAEDANRQQLVVWMTARLAKGLAVHFLQQLSRREEVATELPQVRQQCQVWDQEVALRKKKQGVPVTPKTPAVAQSQALAETVNVRQLATGFELILLWDGRRQGARLVLSIVEMRQWLDVLYRLFCRAGWSTDFWPEWLCQAQKQLASPSQGVATKAVLH
ncbi:hypothetical protein [Desulfuromonas thiophila]|uniref:hypothetical protein n=1 Tax=Desulfuromonas thiophila TaxID=57664 RepID=UPI0024A88DE2|nr:hypothetical protein [Desulfuromonas thiophila]